jgi:transcriptional regulator with XRE-family HTH domain
VDDATPLGERIAYYRRRRGLSQVKLAGLLGRSESWLSQVERGVRSIDRISVLTQVAAALNVPVTELSPRPACAGARGERPTVQAVRLALSDQAALALLFREPAAGEASDLADLRAKAAQAWELVHASRYEELGALLPILIQDCEAACRGLTGADRQAAFQVAADAYQAGPAQWNDHRDARLEPSAAPRLP